MSDKYVLRDGVPVLEPEILAWATWFENANDQRRVALTDEGDDLVVSTVFLGIDHAFGDRPPLLYETLVRGRVLTGEMERYATRAEAEAGHEAMVARVRAAMADDGEGMRG